MRHGLGLAGVVDDVAADHKYRHALMLLGRGGEAVEIEPAQVHRQTDRRHRTTRSAAWRARNRRASRRQSHRRRSAPGCRTAGATTAIATACAWRVAGSAARQWSRCLRAVRRLRQPVRARLDFDGRLIALGIGGRDRRGFRLRRRNRRRGGGIGALGRIGWQRLSTGASNAGSSAGGSAVGAHANVKLLRRSLRSRGRRFGGGFRHGLDRAAHRRQRLGCGDKLLLMGQFGVPDRAAAHATHLAAVRPQACHVDIVGCSAVRADDQHWTNSGWRGTFGGEPSSRSVNGLETNPARRARPSPGVLSYCGMGESGVRTEPQSAQGHA